MDTITKYKVLLYVIMIIAGSIMVASVISLKSVGAVHIYAWQSLGIFGSVVVFSLCFFPLCYQSWFQHSTKNVIYYLRQAFYWTLVITFSIVIVGIAIKYLG